MSAAQMSYRPRGLYIGGEWCASRAGRTMRTINPATGEVLGEVPWAGEEDVAAAVAAAQRGAAEWRRVPPAERARCLERLAARITDHVDELALMDAVDSGNAISGMRTDMELAAATLRYFAGLVREIKGETIVNGPHHLNYTLRQPYGVVGKINAFNHPFRFCAEKAAAPLAAGNSVVIKQPEQAPLSGLRFGELCADLFPPGVVNVLTGDAVAGSALVRHPGVRRVAFIGSVETGRIVAREAADTIKHVSLELGGKNPIIIFPDADPDEAAKLAIRGMNMNRQGQSCSSTSRVFVHESLHERVVERLVAAAEASAGGSAVGGRLGGRPAHLAGAARPGARATSRRGKAEGARLLTGGGPPEDARLDGGFFIAPTVFDAVTPAMRIAREEIFGPVISVLRWHDYEQLLAEANSLIYGLTAAIVTNDLKLALETADRIEAGYVWINSAGRYLGAPYGGWKQSGIGREESLDELLSYTQIKNVNVALVTEWRWMGLGGADLTPRPPSPIAEAIERGCRFPLSRE